MVKFKTDILVRNNRLSQMQERSIFVSYEILSDDAYVLELKKKLIEEATEVNNTKNKSELTEELADVLEVFEHIIEVSQIDINEIHLKKKEKQIKIGRFDKKIKINFVEMDDNHPDTEYYLKNSHKYPKIK